MRPWFGEIALKSLNSARRGGGIQMSSLNNNWPGLSLCSGNS